MASSTNGHSKDPSTLGTSGYARADLDHYPTPPRATEALMTAVGDDLAGYMGWEPCCGDGAITNVVKDHFRNFVSTDIIEYEGFKPDGLLDFFKADLDHVSVLPTNFTPDCIITNPPYGKDAERVARHALKLMEPEKGMVFLLCRHEWDTAKSRADLFDHPAFCTKITMRFRPRWIVGSEGAPRFSYSWFHWDWSKPAGVRPELIYVN